jgi:hypothetical protein
MILWLKTLSIKGYSLIEIWAGYEDSEDMLEIRVEVCLYRLCFNPILIRWLKGG